ncbi:MAG: hypothetical protein KF850_24290 [Labilithrix sp.]|nr:hypothetical protein [Labilithrix sp.]
MRNDQKAASERYEPTERAQRERAADFYARGMIEAGVGLHTARDVFTGKRDAYKSAATRRALAWYLKRQYLRPVRSAEPPKPAQTTTIADDLQRAARVLAAKAAP